MALPQAHDQKSPTPPAPWRGAPAGWLTPVLLLCFAYALLGLTITSPHSHGELMDRCVLMSPNLARIWSVSNIEIGLSYFGVFVGMVFYFLRLYRQSRQHLIDLGLALTYLACSFALDYFCVEHLEPFLAMLVGDAVVMTFTLIVSRQLWFQRLLGVFVPMVFLTCAFGHFMEGLSYWRLTYPLNVPWMMVTADIGFAVLVNSARFPGLIRGEDVVVELTAEKARVAALETEITARVAAEEKLRESELLRQAETLRRESFARNMMLAVSGGRIRLHSDRSDLPGPLPQIDFQTDDLTTSTLSYVRRQAGQAAGLDNFPPPRRNALLSASAEALMNAVVHGNGGSVVVSSHRDAARKTVQIRVEDQGSGLDWETLPYATLQSGWSSKGTLGMGFTIMATTDAVDILTGPQGTTIVLTMASVEPEHRHFALANSRATATVEAAANTAASLTVPERR